MKARASAALPLTSSGGIDRSARRLTLRSMPSGVRRPWRWLSRTLTVMPLSGSTQIVRVTWA